MWWGFGRVLCDRLIMLMKREKNSGEWDRERGVELIQKFVIGGFMLRVCRLRNGNWVGIS
jgi:hypothetical protein